MTPEYYKTMDCLIRVAAGAFQVMREEICGGSKKSQFVEARTWIAKEARKGGLSYSQIGFCMGRRDPSTIRNLCRRPQ